MYFPHFEVNKGYCREDPSSWRRNAFSRDRHPSDNLNGESRCLGRGTGDFVQSRASFIERPLGRHGVVGTWSGR